MAETIAPPEGFVLDAPKSDIPPPPPGFVLNEPEATTAGRAAAGVGGLNKFVAGTLGLPVDTAENIINLFKASAGTAALASGRPDLAPDLTKGSFGGSEHIASLLEKLGINTQNPQPQDPASRMLYTAGMIAPSAMIPGGRNISQAANITLKEKLAAAAGSAPGSAALAATGGAVAGETLGPEYVGVGTLLPAAGLKAGIDFNNRIASRVSPAVDTFRQAGTMPSVGQATDNTFLHGLENLAAKFPGGSGVMKNFIETQQRQMGIQARTGIPAEAAGRAIESGIQGSGGFLERTKATWQGLENAMSRKIPQDYKFPPMATAQALDDLTTPMEGAQATTGGLINPKLIKMRDDLHSDIQNGKGELPFEAIRALRTKVGSMLDESIVSGVPNGELKKVYGALSKDIEQAAVSAGAGPEFALQNNYYRARMDRIESVLDRVIGKNRQPEDIFKAVNPTDPDQANKLRAVMRSLQPDQRQIVSEAVANRLGRALPSNQNEAGDIFSSERFLTNWNRLSPGAKQQLFPEPPLRENLEKLAKASAFIREGKGIYSNPSGTAGSFAAYSVYSSPIVSFATGNLAPVMAGAGAAGGAYLGAKMLTSPKIVEWLATPIKPGSPQATAHLVRLGVIYNQSSPELKQEMSKFVQSITQSGIEGRQYGGPVNAGQPYVVGERGPEVIVPQAQGSVIPNAWMEKLRDMRAFSGGPAWAEAMQKIVQEQQKAMFMEQAMKAAEAQWLREHSKTLGSVNAGQPQPRDLMVPSEQGLDFVPPSSPGESGMQGIRG